MISMRHTLLSMAVIFAYSTAIHAQRSTEVVKWNATISKSTSSSASVALTATIQDGWHVYALSQPAGGPMPLKISIPSGAPFAIQAPIAEAKVTRRQDPSFNMETVFYVTAVNLTVNVKKDNTTAVDSLPVDVRFQACNDRLCLPPYTAHMTAASREK